MDRQKTRMMNRNKVDSMGKEAPPKDGQKEGPERSTSYRWLTGPQTVQLAIDFTLTFRRMQIASMPPAERPDLMKQAVKSYLSDLVDQMFDTDHLEISLAQPQQFDHELGKAVDIERMNRLMRYAGQVVHNHSGGFGFTPQIDSMNAQAEAQVTDAEKALMEGAGLKPLEFGYAYMLLVVSAACVQVGIDPATSMSKLLDYLVALHAAQRERPKPANLN